MCYGILLVIMPPGYPIIFDFLTNLLKTITMKKIILLMVISMAILSVTAQEKVKQKELGLVFRNFDNFGLMYKFGDQNSMWRLKSIYGNSNKDEIESDYTNRITKRKRLSVSLGKQFVVQIQEKFYFIYGVDLSTSFYNSNIENKYDSEEVYSETTEKNNLVLGLNGVIGFNYLLGERFVFGFEILPGASYSIGKENQKSTMEDSVDKEYNLSRFFLGLSSSSALLNFAYKF